MTIRRQLEIQTAAFLFTRGKTARQIANALDRHERHIYRLMDEPLWDKTLDMLDFTGEKSFRKQPTRSVDTEKVNQAFHTWKAFIEGGGSVRNAARVTAEQTGIKIRTIRDWERKFGWRAMIGVDK